MYRESTTVMQGGGRHSCLARFVPKSRCEEGSEMLGDVLRPCGVGSSTAASRPSSQFSAGVWPHQSCSPVPGAEDQLLRLFPLMPSLLQDPWYF